MMSHTAPRSEIRDYRKLLLIPLGLFMAYSLFYFLFVRPSLGDVRPVSERYLKLAKEEDWKKMETLHANTEVSDTTLKEWKRLRQDYGRLLGYQVQGASMLKVPTFTRGMMGYHLQFEKGEIQAMMTFHPRMGHWKISDARFHFRPPMPFPAPGTELRAVQNN